MARTDDAADFADAADPGDAARTPAPQRPVHPGYPVELTRRDVGDASDDGWVGDAAPPSAPVRLVDPDPTWPDRFAAESALIRATLGDVAVRIEHVGSTSVAGLAAKPVVDIDVQVADPADEDAYVPPLEAAGYRLVLREPWWQGHRMFIGPGAGNGGGTAPGSHVHVFPVGAAEPLRHLLFRDWLRTHPDDRDLYATVKRDLARRTADSPGDYTLAKNAVIDEIYARIFAAHPSTHPSWPGGSPDGARGDDPH